MHSSAPGSAKFQVWRTSPVPFKYKLLFHALESLNMSGLLSRCQNISLHSHKKDFQNKETGIDVALFHNLRPLWVEQFLPPSFTWTKDLVRNHVWLSAFGYFLQSEMTTSSFFPWPWHFWRLKGSYSEECFEFVW